MLIVLAIFTSHKNRTEDPSEEKVQGLVERAVKGERTAAVQLYRLYVHRVYRTVRPMCVSDAEAEDIVQESFIKTFRALSRYRRKSGSRFISWLLTIAVNTARKRLKRKRHVPTSPEAIEKLGGAVTSDPTAEAIEMADAALKRDCLLRALGELDERSRKVLTLRYGAGLSVAEAAEACALSEANVRKICQRQRSVLLQRITTLVAASEDAEGGERV